MYPALTHTVYPPPLPPPHTQEIRAAAASMQAASEDGLSRAAEVGREGHSGGGGEVEAEGGCGRLSG